MHLPIGSNGNQPFLEKFSDLIIQKCIDMCNSGSVTQMTCNGAAELIKNYFYKFNPTERVDELYQNWNHYSDLPSPKNYISKEK